MDLGTANRLQDKNIGVERMAIYNHLFIYRHTIVGFSCQNDWSTCLLYRVSRSYKTGNDSCLCEADADLLAFNKAKPSAY